MGRERDSTAVAVLEYSFGTRSVRDAQELITLYIPAFHLSFQLTLVRRDSVRLSVLAGKINTSTSNASESYRRLMRLSTAASPELLRAYAFVMLQK